MLQKSSFIRLCSALFAIVPDRSNFKLNGYEQVFRYFILSDMKEMKQSFSENGVSLIVFADLSDEAPYLLQIGQDKETFKSKFCRCKHMYELAKLYEATGREAEALAMAKQIIAKKVKISSSTIAVIKREMQELVNRINNKCLIKKQIKNRLI